ncbi:MAG: FKBP-type peptidyl-prolyl cis-trans isomerase [Ferruginibacter sp.]
MNQFFLVISISLAVSISVQAQKPKLKVVNPAGVTAKPRSVLRNSTDSFSYALGLNIANNLKQQGINKISNAAMQRALDDVFIKKTFLMNDQQANLCIQEKIRENMSKINEAVKSKGTAFLAENKKREGVITLPDGLQYEVLKKGEQNSPMPRLQDTVVVHYAGTLINGEKFDNSYDRGEPLSIAVNGVITGWKEILQVMHIGDKMKVFIPSDLGYGDRGAGANIPGGSTLIFEMELLAIKPAGVTESIKPE